TSPHAIMYADYFHISPGKGAKGSFADFMAPEVRFSEEYDEDLVSIISGLADEYGLDAGTLGERDKKLDHGTMVPLWFIRNKYKGGKIVRIGLSGLPLTDHYKLGMIIKEAAERLDRKVVFVASGDLSHKLQTYGPYGFAPEGPVYDERIMDVMGRAAFGELFEFDETFCHKAAECGHRSFVIMAGAFDRTRVRVEKLSHQDVTGVGYGICTFYPEGEDPERHFLDSYFEKIEAELDAKREAADPYVKLAYKAIEDYILRKKITKVPEGLPAEMTDNAAGTFVSIHEHGALRGCIGTIAPTRDSIAQEIISNAISASTRDTRFTPIQPDELKYLDINVDVLGQPEDIDSEEELDVKRYGVIVTSGYKRGLLLPDIEGVDTVREQVDIAMRKGGIKKTDKYILQRFEVIRHY
ncbi:MAG: AmmeMemoRadiSam system protein A, partial [Lachnospiraceae bacterium]|nr:AmmeMemoRadiSam system protein A [Lachnospiraceae bacterium]